jgi:hypothetical protein
MCRAVSITRSDLGTAASQQAALHSRDYQLMPIADGGGKVRPTVTRRG